MMGFVYGRDQVFYFLDQIIMFGAGAGYTNGICFLKGIITNQMLAPALSDIAQEQNPSMRRLIR